MAANDPNATAHFTDARVAAAADYYLPAEPRQRNYWCVMKLLRPVVIGDGETPADEHARIAPVVRGSSRDAIVLRPRSVQLQVSVSSRRPAHGSTLHGSRVTRYTFPFQRARPAGMCGSRHPPSARRQGSLPESAET